MIVGPVRKGGTAHSRRAGAVTACALDGWALFCRVPSRAKAAARAADPMSRALETDASWLNRGAFAVHEVHRAFLVSGARFPAVLQSVSVAGSGVERRGSPQTKTSQTRLSPGTFRRTALPRSLLTTSLAVGRRHVYGSDGPLREPGERDVQGWDVERLGVYTRTVCWRDCVLRQRALHGGEEAVCTSVTLRIQFVCIG